jgi:oxygen-independent coproporphyrinogen-3 oxidase
MCCIIGQNKFFESEFSLDPFSLYLHIPYCEHKCGYCDFNSHPIKDEQPRDYPEAILKEIEYAAKNTQPGQKVTTIFFGGGTPTSLPPEDLERILMGCFNFFNVNQDAEITLEANPGTIMPGYFEHVKSAGFNRVSIGAQSFIPHELELLERIHGPEAIGRTVEQAKKEGFDNVSVDLMFALPNQSLEDWDFSLKQAIALNPNHISAYNLTIEPKTAFYSYANSGKITPPDDESQLKLFKHTLKTLAETDYAKYEISNYAKPGKKCRHNINYWKNGNYIGLGAGASSYWGGARRKNINSPTAYIEQALTTGQALDLEEIPSSLVSMGETMMLGLRLSDGIKLKDFEDRYEVSLSDQFPDQLQFLKSQNLVTMDEKHIRLSEKGFFLADSVIMEFMP